VNIAFAVTVDARGDVIAAGTLDNKDLGLPLRGTSLAVVKLEDLGGEELWRHELAFGAPDATGEGCNIAVCLFNFAAAVRVDARGDVIAAGFRLVGRTVYDFTVVKVQGSDGADLPFFPGPPDPS
jgi:hypothetical protein